MPRSIPTLILALTLTGCTQALMTNPESSQAALLLDTPKSTEDLQEEGTKFFGKFATNSAINSRRSFTASYHGELRITLYKNTKVECHFWMEGWHEEKPIDAASMLCSGRLQSDSSFEFQGVTIEDQTFTLRGTRKDDAIEGELAIGEEAVRFTVRQTPDQTTQS